MKAYYCYRHILLQTTTLTRLFYLFYLWMIFNLIKEKNRLFSKGMPNIYLKVTTETL